MQAHPAFLLHLQKSEWSGSAWRIWVRQKSAKIYVGVRTQARRWTKRFKIVEKLRFEDTMKIKTIVFEPNLSRSVADLDPHGSGTFALIRIRNFISGSRK